MDHMRRHRANRDGVALFFLMLPIVLPLVALLDSFGFFSVDWANRLLLFSIVAFALCVLLLTAVMSAITKLADMHRRGWGSFRASAHRAWSRWLAALVSSGSMRASG